MAKDDVFLPPLDEQKSSDKVALLPPIEEEGTATKLAKQAAGGFREAIPFVGEGMAEKAGIPKPQGMTEKLTRRGARLAPYFALPAATGVGVLPSALGLGAATLGGQLVEELGYGPLPQAGAEILGGGVGQATGTIAGKTLGYIEPQLVELSKKASKFFEIGPGARTAKGMKYGAGETEAQAIRNVNNFTLEATKRAGSEAKKVDGEWIKKTGDALGSEANSIFGNKTFQTNQQFLNDVNSLVVRAEGAFGEQGNVVKSILEKNIQGQRPRGELVGPTFAASDLQKAIIEVNQKLSGASGNAASLLYDLKDSLEKLAKANLQSYGPNLVKKYDDWKSKYHAFATIRDIGERAGVEGLTAAGQINPKAAFDVIKERTGGNPVRNVLHDNLGEFGNLMPYKRFPETGAMKAIMGAATETPLAKALKVGLQPRAPSKLGERMRAAATFAPGATQMQITPEDVELLPR